MSFSLPNSVIQENTMKVHAPLQFEFGITQIKALNLHFVFGYMQPFKSLWILVFQFFKVPISLNFEKMKFLNSVPSLKQSLSLKNKKKELAVEFVYSYSRKVKCEQSVVYLFGCHCSQEKNVDFISFFNLYAFPLSPVTSTFTNTASCRNCFMLKIKNNKQ